MTAAPLPDDDTPDDPLGIDPELIKELDAKSKEIVDEAVAARNIGELLDPEQIFPSPGNPMGVARRLLKDWTHDGLTTLLHWRGSWMEWQFTHWVEVEEGAIRSQVYFRLEKAVYLVALKPDRRTGQRAEEPAEKKTLADLASPWLPNRRKVGDVMEALKGCVHLGESIGTPNWVRGAHVKPADELVACTNGLLHVGTRELLKLTPAYFNRVSVPFNYDPAAPPPTEWLAFLNALWPNDPDSIKVLQEWFGYVLSGRTDLHKIALMIGPPRSGRGTIARILEAMIGKGNAAASTLASLGTNFGLAPLIGKPLAVVGDVRLGSSNLHQALERLLSISGEDLITIDRKYKDQWTGKLPTRFMLISNELPRFPDASGAIATRFVVMQLEESFLGREDRGLDAKLRAELTGILTWALEGLDRIIRQPFTISKASDEAVRDLQDLVSPTSAFVRDLCARGAEHDIEIKELYQTWRDWCLDNGHHPTSSTVFARDLRAVHSKLRVFKPHAQPRRFGGLTLKSKVKVEPTYKENGGSSGSDGSAKALEPPSEPSEPSEPPFPFYVARTDDASEAGPSSDSSDAQDSSDTGDGVSASDDGLGLPVPPTSCMHCAQPLTTPNPACLAREWHNA
jgi:putative DNA primase/helicase